MAPDPPPGLGAGKAGYLGFCVPTSEDKVAHHQRLFPPRGLFIARARAERPGYRRYCLGLTSPSIRQGELAALSSALVSHVGQLTAGSAQVLPGPFC